MGSVSGITLKIYVASGDQISTKLSLPKLTNGLICSTNAKTLNNYVRKVTVQVTITPSKS